LLDLLALLVACRAGVLEGEPLAVLDADSVRPDLPAGRLQQLLRLFGVVLVVALDPRVVGPGLRGDIGLGLGHQPQEDLVDDRFLVHPEVEGLPDPFVLKQRQQEVGRDAVIGGTGRDETG